MTFEEKIQIFYKRALETCGDMNTFVTNCDKFQKEWRFAYPSVEICKTYCHEAEKEIKLIKCRLINKSLKCVVIGKVSSGKSTLINALLSKKILPSGFSCRTNCFIEVKKSSDGRNYIVVGDEEKSIDLLKDLADDFSPDALPPGSHIELFYSSSVPSVFDENVVMLDTPGFDDVSLLDDVIEKTCNDADVLILMVSSIIGLGETERNFIRKHQTIFSKFNILMLYSFWDKPQSENVERSKMLKVKLLQQAKQYLHEGLNIPLEETDDKIFFVSAEEKLLSSFIKQDSTDLSAQCRNDEFDKFICCLKAFMSRNSYNRRHAVVEDIYKIFESTFVEMEFCIEEINMKNQIFADKLRGDLAALCDFNDKINSEIKSLFKEAYDQFFDKGLEIIKCEVVSTDEDIKEKLSTLLWEVTTITVESVKLRILDLVDVRDIDLHNHCLNILKTLYLPNYFSLKTEIKAFRMDLLQQCFVEINRVKRIGTGISIGGAVVGAAATLASGGILAGIVLPIPTLFGASALGFAGAAVGGSAGGGVSTALIAFNREAFSYFYQKEEDTIKASWKQIEERIVDSYQVFFDQLSKRVEKLIDPLKEQFFTLPNKINFLRSESMKMKSAHCTPPL